MVGCSSLLFVVFARCSFLFVVHCWSSLFVMCVDAWWVEGLVLLYVDICYCLLSFAIVRSCLLCVVCCFVFSLCVVVCYLTVVVGRCCCLLFVCCVC